MKQRLLFKTLILLCATFPLCASSALRYDSSVEIIREDKTEYFAERMTIDGDNVRVDFLDKEGHPNGSYIVSNDVGKTMAIHDGSRSLCAAWNRAEYFQARAAALGKGRRMIKANISSVNTTVVSEEDGPAIEGYPTRHLKIKTDYSAEGRFLFLKIDYKVEELDDLWIADSLAVPAFAEDWLQASSQTGDAFLDEHARVWMDNTRGSILKHTNIVRLIKKKSGDVEEKTEHLTISNIMQVPVEKLPQDIFTFPPDCKKVKQSEMKHQAERMLKKYLR